MIIVIFGPPGSGKGSQSKMMQEAFGFVHISTGDLLRHEILEKSDIGKIIEDSMRSGSLVDDSLINMLCADKIKESLGCHIVLDGFPRTLEQARFLEKTLKSLSLNLDLVLYFDVDTDKLEERILGRYQCTTCGSVYHRIHKKVKVDGFCDECKGNCFTERLDDNAEVFKKRVVSYLKETNSLKDYYENQGMLKRIDASRSFSQVSEEIRLCLGKISDINIKR